MRKSPTQTTKSSRPTMKAHQEKGEANNANEEKTHQKFVINSNDLKSSFKSCTPLQKTKNECKTKVFSSSESDTDEDVFLKDASLQDDASFFKELKLLKSTRTSRTLEKSFSNYLPTYSIGSDTEESGEP